jgi:uncharacterized integral membrane protein
MTTAPHEPLSPEPPSSQPPSSQPPAVEPPSSQPSAFQPSSYEAPLAPEKKARVSHTRTSAAWLGVWAGVVVLILLIIFVAQNTSSVRIAFFGLEGSIPLALALLIAGVPGAIIAMAVAGLRILQLRRQIRHGRPKITR